MEKWHLTENQIEKLITGSIILVGAFVMFGQAIDSRSISENDWVTTVKTYIDPVQYMVGMLFINFILVFWAIKKHEQIPNPLLNIFKWNFFMLFLNDFIVLLLRVIQSNNLIPMKASLTMGMGRMYTMMVTARSLTEQTMTSAATLLLVAGLARYAPLNGREPVGLSKLGKTMCLTVILQWAVSIPVSFAAYISSPLLFDVSLALGQFGQLAVIGMVFWTVKEYYQQYHTKFFRYLNQYYGITLFLTGLILTYSIGSLGVLQRFPAGESEVFSGFGWVVFYTTRLAYIVLNYLMFRAITSYRESGMVLPGELIK